MKLITCFAMVYERVPLRLPAILFERNKNVLILSFYGIILLIIFIFPLCYIHVPQQQRRRAMPQNSARETTPTRCRCCCGDVCNQSHVPTTHYLPRSYCTNCNKHICTYSVTLISYHYVPGLPVSSHPLALIFSN